jgi:cell filamentation protein
VSSAVFDPFGDFETRGYLQNFEGLKRMDEVKVLEHTFFEANLEDEFEFLGTVKGALTYKHFLKVHHVLFSDFYPWAGQDRWQLGVGQFVEKGNFQFEVSSLAQRAVEWGLEMGNDPVVLAKKPGVVMGQFAWGHPFLDGNGRTMLIVHTELCSRANFSIDWSSSKKMDYLQALTQELRTPDRGLLDGYFKPLIRKLPARKVWMDHIKALPGLDGAHTEDDNMAYAADDVQAKQRYEEASQLRKRSQQG